MTLTPGFVAAALAVVALAVREGMLTADEVEDVAVEAESERLNRLAAGEPAPSGHTVGPDHTPARRR